MMNTLNVISDRRNFLMYSLLLFFIMTFPVFANGQCGTDEIHEQMMKDNPDYRKNYILQNQEIKDLILKKQGSKSVDDQTIFTIPVVVHVIHLGEAVGTGSNISDFQINEAIRGLNERYRNIIGNGEDMQLDFCLAVRDPEGHPTNGINRVDGRSVALYQSGGIKRTVEPSCDNLAANDADVKRLSKWPVLDYYNIWVVNKICGGWAGYAYYPWGGGEDGTVISSKYMTYANTTLTHEIGHGFNLAHTFNGDGGNLNCPENTDCLTQGDFVCDTPPHKQNDCGSSNPCTSSSIWNNTKNNYMSYCGPSSSQALFTSGQKERLRASLNTFPRANLLKSSRCIASPKTEISVKEIVGPINTVCASNQLIPEFKVLNIGDEVVNSFKVTYTLNNGTPEVYNWSGIVNQGSEALVKLPKLTEKLGENILDINISMLNGIEDTNHINTNKNVVFNFSPSSCFITVWKTDNVGSSSQRQIEIPGSSNSNYDIYWEEVGNPSNYQTNRGISNSTIISFPRVGQYRTFIGPKENGFNQINFSESSDNLKLLEIEQWGDIVWTSFESAFINCKNMTVSAIDKPDLDQVKNMTNMFSGAKSFNHSIGDWNLNSNLRMDGMLSFSGLQCDNYNNTLIGWANNPLTPSGLNLGAESISYGKDAIEAREILISKGWTINDAGLDENCKSVSTEIKEKQNKFVLFQIYPNPNDGYFTIEIESTKVSNAKLEIMNSSGQIIQTQPIKHLNGKRIININLSKSSKGLYFVKLYFNNEIISRRFVIQ